MSLEYAYLKRYKPGGNGINDNWFFDVDIEDIVNGENLIEQNFPKPLREFYISIGYGMLRSPHIVPEDYQFYNNNMIFPPLVAAHFYRGIIEHQIEAKEEALEFEDHWLAQWTLDMFEPGDLPFFEIGDSCRFLMMKLHSNNPNAVWAFGNIKIEDSFERFIWRLYHEDPGYYDDIIERHYQ